MKSQNQKNQSARTMRIDISPKEARSRKSGQADRRDKGSTSIIELRNNARLHSPDYENLLQSIYDGVLIADDTGRIVDFNHRAVAFFAGEDGDLTGASVISLISGADPSLLNSIFKNLQQHRYTLIEAQCIGDRGVLFPAEVAVNRIVVCDEALLCFLVRDISIRKKAQRDLEAAVARLEEHDRARFQFVSNVSHELRTPLTSMIYAVDNMLKGVVGPISSRVRDYLKMLHGDCRRLLGTVNDILDIRKIEMNDLKLAQARLPFQRLVRISAESLAMQAQQKNIALKFSFGHGNWFVNCDSQKMERVILNIVGNAVKFTPDHGEITVSLHDAPDKEGWVELGVEDTGIGIPTSSLDKVTVRYYTVGEQSSGTGLGLAIAKEIVDLHGGAIRIESPVRGKSIGTGVYIRMPTVQPPLVLVADANREDNDCLSHLLLGQGYRVEQTFDGPSALSLVKALSPDVLVSELILPGMGGSELILKLKADKETRRFPIVVTTAGVLVREKAELLGSFSIPAIPKPCAEESFLEKLVSVLAGNATFQVFRPKITTTDE